MNDDKFEGGDGGVDVRQEIETQVPHSPPLPEWIVRQREQALRTVREATVQEIACLFSAQVRATVLRIQMGRVPTFDQEWIAVQTAASFLDSPPTEQGQEARSNREVMIIQIIKAHARLSAPRPDPSTIELCWDPERTQEEADEEIRCILDNWTPDPKFAAEHAQHCAQYPWITYRLGYRTSPVEIIEPIAPPRPLRPEKDRFTLMSVRKARERARDRDQPIDARWEASAQTILRRRGRDRDVPADGGRQRHPGVHPRPHQEQARLYPR